MASRVLHAFQTHRTRLSRLVLVLAVVAIGLQLHSGLPQEIPVTFQLGSDHYQVTELRVAYVQDGQVHRGVHFRYPNGAPDQVHHDVDLASGDYHVECDVVKKDGSQTHVTRSLSIPTEDRPRLRIEP